MSIPKIAPQSIAKALPTKKVIALAIVSMCALCGCQNFSANAGSAANNTPAVRASLSEAEYFTKAKNAMDANQSYEAVRYLEDLRAFYPAGAHAEDALLLLMYAKFSANDLESATTLASDFITLYPNSPHVDYAYYTRGVAYMAGSPKMGKLFLLDAAERDTSYLRLAHQDLQFLAQNFPQSDYLADAGQRLNYLYNQFARHELLIAQYYFDINAPVAATARALWVFEHYPNADTTGQAVAMLAHGYRMLGANDLSDNYQKILAANYPQYLQGGELGKMPRLESNSGISVRLINMLKPKRLY